MKAPEKSAQVEYSQREILEEIFKKFYKLKGSLNPGITAHMIINQELLKKLRLRLGAEKFGLAEKMPMKVAYPFTCQERDDLETGIPYDIEGELFTLFPTDDKNLPISCVAMPLDESELTETWNESKFTAKMAGGAFRIIFSKSDKNVSSTIYLAQLRNGVFKISSRQQKLDRI